MSPRISMVAYVSITTLFAIRPIAIAQNTSGPATPNRGSQTSSNARPPVVLDHLCTALRENYPMLEYVGWQEEWAADARKRVEGAGSVQEAFEVMDELVCRLNDYHTKLVWPNKPRLSPAPFAVEPVTRSKSANDDHGIWGQVRPPAQMPQLSDISLVVVDAAAGTRSGDKILEVNGNPVQEALAKAWRHAVGSSIAGKLRSAAWRMLGDTADGQLRLKLSRREPTGPDSIVELIVDRSVPSSGTEAVSSRETEGVPLIRIARFGNRPGENLVARFDELLNQYRNRPELIIDVRGNGGGEDGFAGDIVGRFIKAPVIASISFHRQVPALTFERTVELTEPRIWRYEGRVAVLTDEGCMSATEHFVSGMSEAHALLCGTPTSGACGWIRKVELSGQATLYVSQTFPLHTGGIPSPSLGIAPNVWAVRTLEDVRAGSDTALRAAIDWLRSGSNSPARYQPISAFSNGR